MFYIYKFLNSASDMGTEATTALITCLYLEMEIWHTTMVLSESYMTGKKINSYTTLAIPRTSPGSTMHIIYKKNL